jgi:hypothetical protein
MDCRKSCAKALIGVMVSLALSAGWPALAASSGEAMQNATQQPASGQQSTTVPAQTAMHTITVTFDYDFTLTPACAGKVKTNCVTKFSVYDISGPKPIFLYSLPVPANAKGFMKGIAATSPRMAFEVGKHRIGVAAQTADGKESPPRECKAIIEIKAPVPDASESH